MPNELSTGCIGVSMHMGEDAFWVRLEDTFEVFLFIIDNIVILIIVVYFIINIYKAKVEKILKCTPMHSFPNFNSH